MAVSKVVKPQISRVVREVIDFDLSLQDALQRGYGNISAIARLIKPKVDEGIEKEANLQSVITAIKRIRFEYTQPSAHILSVASRSVVNVRTDVAKISVERTRMSLETVRKMLAEHQEEFLQVSESTSAITLIFDQSLVVDIHRLFGKRSILEEATGLAAIIVHSSEEIIKTPGCIITFLNQVSRRRINIEDVVSCYTDTIIVVKMDEVGRAFTALTDFISAARRSLQVEKSAEAT